MTASPARYIGIESADGAGKDLQTELLLQAFAAAGIPCSGANEPKSTPDGAHLYDLITSGAQHRWTGFAEACLWSAARNKANLEYIQPALAQGTWVVANRTPLATIAYQGYARGCDLELIRAMQVAAAPKWPDFFLLLDVDPDIAMGRKLAQKGQANLDRLEMEGVSFQEKVRAGLQAEMQRLTGPWQVVDASQSKADVHRAILVAVNQQFGLNLQEIPC